MGDFSEFLWEVDSKSGTMNSCYRLYSWINHTVLMLLLQILWKVSQISDYFKDKPLKDSPSETTFAITPLTMASKQRRHIRSMSDVQSSTPYRLPYKLPFRSRRGSTHILTYDSDSRARRIMTYNHQKLMDSSDSSDYAETPRKRKSIEQNILKHSDSMRVL